VVVDGEEELEVGADILGGLVNGVCTHWPPDVGVEGEGVDAFALGELDLFFQCLHCVFCVKHVMSEQEARIRCSGAGDESK